MNKTKTKTDSKGLTMIPLLLVLLVCGTVVFAADSPDASLSPQTKRELANARHGTARYHDIDKAIADGYVNINVCFPMMGCHYARPETQGGGFDELFDPARPELLVYHDFGNGKPRLVALEYAVPLALSENPPEGFTGDADEWHENTDFGLWTLHAWVWYPNPDGMFAAYNPRIP